MQKKELTETRWDPRLGVNQVPLLYFLSLIGLLVLSSVTDCQGGGQRRGTMAARAVALSSWADSTDLRLPEPAFLQGRIKGSVPLGESGQLFSLCKTAHDDYLRFKRKNFCWALSVVLDP